MTSKKLHIFQNFDCQAQEFLETRPDKIMKLMMYSKDNVHLTLQKIKVFKPFME